MQLSKLGGVQTRVLPALSESWRLSCHRSLSNMAGLSVKDMTVPDTLRTQPLLSPASGQY
jgi:hypothetical protein